MTTYRIINRTSGLDLGTYTAASPEEAASAMRRDAGYATDEDCADVLDIDVDDINVDLIIEEVDAAAMEG